jgi:SAM-dependent methyltransferase
VEYPWAYFFGQTSVGMRVIDVGGGLSGLQFVLSREGCRVTNVDPGTDPHQAWQGSSEDHARLNWAFGTDVELILERMEDYDAESSSADRVFCISVIEHMDNESAVATLKNIGRLLRPGGLCIMTVDLCLDIHPFTKVMENEIGVNKNIASLVSSSRLELAFGYREEPFGFNDFCADYIKRKVSEFLVGDFHIPVVAQLFMLRNAPDKTYLAAACFHVRVRATFA